MKGMNFSAPLDAVISVMKKTGKKISDSYKKADAASKTPEAKARAKRLIETEG